MASTADGRELTRAHQAKQLQIAASAMAQARVLWPLLDVTDLDGSTPRWVAATSSVVDRQIRQSQTAAGLYLSEYRRAELGQPADDSWVVPGRVVGTLTALRVAGPVRIKRLIGGGMDRLEAKDAAFGKFAGIVSRQTLMGGRLTIARSAGRDPKVLGWRRVTDGNPCAFCAMLASRGPVYKDAAAADGLAYHAHCGCTAEPEYWTWEPTEEEARYREIYEQSRVGKGKFNAVDTKATLAEMRRTGEFRDSVKRPH